VKGGQFEGNQQEEGGKEKILRGKRIEIHYVHMFENI
jgi:hypothetical protein